MNVFYEQMSNGGIFSAICKDNHFCLFLKHVVLRCTSSVFVHMNLFLHDLLYNWRVEEDSLTSPKEPKELESGVFSQVHTVPVHT